MPPSRYYWLKVEIVELLSLSRDTIHLYVGLIVFFATLWLVWHFRKRRSLIIPLIAVATVAVGLELLDCYDDISTARKWSAIASLHDIWNTLFWPVALSLIFRFSSLFRPAFERPEKTADDKDALDTGTQS